MKKTCLFIYFLNHMFHKYESTRALNIPPYKMNFGGVYTTKIQSTTTVNRKLLWSCHDVPEQTWWNYDDVIKWKHFPRYWPFVRGIRRSPVTSPHKHQLRRPLMFSLTCARTNGWVNNRYAGDLRRHRANYDVTVMKKYIPFWSWDIMAWFQGGPCWRI